MKPDVDWTQAAAARSIVIKSLLNQESWNIVSNHTCHRPCIIPRIFFNPATNFFEHWQKVSRQRPRSAMSWKPWKSPGSNLRHKSPSRSEALRFIDSAKSPSTKIDGSSVNFRRRLPIHTGDHGGCWYGHSKEHQSNCEHVLRDSHKSGPQSWKNMARSLAQRNVRNVGRFEKSEPGLFQGFSRHGASWPLSWNFLLMYYTVVPRPTPSSFWTLPRLGTIWQPLLFFNKTNNTTFHFELSKRTGSLLF